MRSQRQRILRLALVCIYFVLLFAGCNSIEGGQSVDKEQTSSETLKKLEEEVSELYSLAPCTENQEYCSFPFLIEKVDELIETFCLENFSQEALDVYTKFVHFVDPSPQQPNC